MLQPDLNDIIKYFRSILSKNISTAALSWLDKNIESIHASENDKSLFTGFSIAPRHVGKSKLTFSEEDLQQARNLHPGFNPANFSADQATRVVLLLCSYKNDSASFINKIEKILGTADIQEQVAIYSSLPLLPYAEKMSARAADGLRTNITAIFEAIALENPYPSEHLSEAAWNQMVVKAIFTNRPLYKIYGFDDRRNAALADMLSDFAHERWAAGRTVTPELWRATTPFLLTGVLWDDIDKILKSDNPLEVEAGCLACSESTLEDAKLRLAKYPSIKSQIESKQLSWNILGKKVEGN
ncbi:MAG: EboA domain-containing protein [Bacteroidota bacterium]|nr:EboA domain-containing protein [Bacteroidota bacterium]